jgi:topoisomerase-4 subunit B
VKYHQTEFAEFIGDNIRKEPVLLNAEAHIQKILEYYMGKNTMQRQEFIINNLRVEIDNPDEIIAKN